MAAARLEAIVRRRSGQAPGATGRPGQEAALEERGAAGREEVSVRPEQQENGIRTA